MRVRLSLLAASVLFGGPVKAQNDQVRRGPVPDWVVPSDPMPVPANASGMVFVRRQDVLIHLDEQGQAQYVGYRIKILHPSALQAGNLSIAWNPAAGAPSVHGIKIYRGTEVVDVLEKASFEILRREDQLEAARLDGMLTAVLRVPDLRVGDELEVGLTTRSNDPFLRDKSSGLLVLAPNPAPGRYTLGMNWVEGQKPNLKMTRDLAAVAKQGDRSVAFRFDNPAPLSPPNDAPPRYQWQRVAEFTDFADWAAISRQFAPLYADAARLADTSPVKQEASRIAAAQTGPLDRASAALKLVQQDVRYIYVGLNGGNLKPASAEETWQRRYGDCKGKTALLLALLAELGVEAEPVLVNTAGLDDGLNERLPNPGMFDHIIVRARIAGKVYWLDGTLPPVAGPSLISVMPYQWVLPLSAKGSSIERLDWRPAAVPNEINLVEMDARAGFDQPARVVSTTIVRGIDGLKQQVQLSGLSPDQLLSGLRQQLVGGTWRTVDQVQWRYDQKAEASVLTIGGTWVIDWEDDGDGARSVALPGGGFSPPDRRARSAEQDQNAPYYSKPDSTCHVTTVRLPANAKPGHWSSKNGFDTRMFGRRYYRAFDIRPDSIRMVRSSTIEQPEISAASAKRDNDRIAAFDNSMAWINYTPASAPSSGSVGGKVPATYEIDWTAENIPCLPSTPMR